jgi:hypothetical protein
MAGNFGGCDGWPDGQYGPRKAILLLPYRRIFEIKLPAHQSHNLDMDCQPDRVLVIGPILLTVQAPD